MLFLLNSAVFQVAWLLCVIGGATQMPWLGPVAVLVALVIPSIGVEGISIFSLIVIIHIIPGEVLSTCNRWIYLGFNLDSRLDVTDNSL